MAFALAETKSRQTNSELRHSWFQELSHREFLTMLSGELQSLLEGKLESWHSDVEPSSGVTEMSRESDFWKAPFVYIEVGTKLATENESRVHEDPDEELPHFQESIRSAAMALTVSQEDEDLLDWDACIETSPTPSRSGTIKVRFKCTGRSKPIPINDPWV